MPIDSKLVGSNERYIFIVGDPTAAGNQGSVLALADAQALAGLFGPVAQQVALLLNASGTYDRARSAVGTTGIPAVNTEGTKITASVGSLSFTPAATATDIWQLVGSATKTIRLLYLSVSGIATAADTREIQLVKRTTANTGGTASQPAVVSHDSNDSPAPSGVVNLYSANPSALGTSAGSPRARKLNLGAAGAAGVVEWDFTTRNSKGLVLRGVAQSACLNWNGAAVPAGTSLCIDAEWSEE